MSVGIYGAVVTVVAYPAVPCNSEPGQVLSEPDIQVLRFSCLTALYAAHVRHLDVWVPSLRYQKETAALFSVTTCRWASYRKPDLTVSFLFPSRSYIRELVHAQPVECIIVMIIRQCDPRLSITKVEAE